MKKVTVFEILCIIAVCGMGLWITQVVWGEPPVQHMECAYIAQGRVYREVLDGPTTTQSVQDCKVATEEQSLYHRHKQVEIEQAAKAKKQWCAARTVKDFSLTQWQECQSL